MHARGDSAHQPQNETQNLANSNIRAAENQAREAGLDPDEKAIIVDCDAASNRMKWLIDLSPCITRSRHNGHWITNRKRRFTLEEMFRLQGMDHTKFVVKVPEIALGQQIGNAMSVNVIERVLLSIFNSTTLLNARISDEWESGERLKHLKATRGKPFLSQEATPKRIMAELPRAQHLHKLRTLIVDSGASLHLVDRNSLTKAERKTIRRMLEPIPLQTANGIVWAEEECDMYVHELKLKVNAIVLEDSPPVLSLGKLCNGNGFKYVWVPREIPYLETKNGTKFLCYPRNDVPFITNSERAEAMPSPESEASGDAEPRGPTEAKAEASGDTEPIPKAKAKAKAKVKVEPEIKNKNTNKNKKISCDSCEHNVWTHFPKDPTCDVCRGAKTDRAHCRSKTHGEPDGLPEPKAFGDGITADHGIINEHDESRTHDKNVCIIQDRATHWIQGYPAKTKNADDARIAFEKILGPELRAKHVYTDNSKEFERALKDLKLPHDTSTPYRPQTNGVAERAVRRVKEGTIVQILQSGFNEEWWHKAVTVYCFLRNITDKIVGGQTPWFKRFGKDFDGPRIPMGAEIKYKPISKNDLKRTHKFGDKRLRGIFVGYKQRHGGGWTGELEIVDWDEVQNAEFASEITVKTFKAPEIEVVKYGEKHRFPLARGDLRQPGPRIREPRIRNRTETEEEEEPQTEASDQEASGDAPPQEIKLEPDTWSITDDLLIRHHNTPRTKLFMPDEIECPLPLKYLDILRRTETDSDYQVERTIRDFWIEAGPRELSTAWVGRTCFTMLRPKPPSGYKWVEGRLTKMQQTNRPDSVWPEMWQHMSKKQKKCEIEEWEKESKL